MSHHPLSAPHRPITASPSPSGDLAVDARTSQVRRAALVAGVSLMLISVLGGWGNFVGVRGLVTPGDPAASAADIMASDGLFRMGILALYALVALDLVIAWALMRVFSPVDEGLSRLDAWFRIAYSAVFLAAISQLAGVTEILGTDGYASAFSANQLQGQAMLKLDAYTDIWMAALVLFGVHLALTGYLAFRSGYVPRVIGVLLVVAGAGYAVDSVVSVLTDSPAFAVASVTFLGEFLLGAFLLFRGQRITLVGGQA